MTECERIIKSGRVKADFLKDEVRNDFFVTTERKKLWMISIFPCRRYSFRGCQTSWICSMG